MGAFFTNVQVRGASVAALVDAITAEAIARGSDVTHEPDAADRSVIVMPPERGWIAIYDQLTESQDIVSLERLATIASRGATAISIAIHDSDILDLRLYQDGVRRDRLDSDPSYYGSVRVSAKRRAATAGDVERWSALVDESQREALAAAFRADDLFAEAILRRVCDVLGVPTEYAFTGYRYRANDPPAEGAVVLRLRDRVRPAWESISDAPTGLDAESYIAGELPLAVGDELRVALGARSTGRASHGLGVRVWGSALPLVSIDHVELVMGDPHTASRRIAKLEPRASREGPMFSVDLPDVEIPAGSPTPFAGFAPGMDMMAMMAAHSRARVHVNVVGSVIAPGHAELGIGLVPLARSEATAGCLVTLAIDPRFELPLRAKAPSSSFLRTLSGDRFLIAWVAFASRAELARFARGALEATRPSWALTDGVTTTTFFAGPQRPKIGRGKVKTMLNGKRCDALVQSIETERCVQVNVAGFAMSAGVGLVVPIEESPVAWCMISQEVGKADGDVRERWTQQIDDAMRTGAALQALIDHRNDAGSGLLDQDAYEHACGLRMGMGLRREYLDRWVRIPSRDRLWMSPAHVARIDRAALEDLAEVAPIGDAVRITLLDPAKWRALQEVLSPLLAAA